MVGDLSAVNISKQDHSNSATLVFFLPYTNDFCSQTSLNGNQEDIVEFVCVCMLPFKMY